MQFPYLKMKNEAFDFETPQSSKTDIGVILVCKKEKWKKPHTGANSIFEGKPKEKEMKKKTSVKNKLRQILNISKDEWIDRRPNKRKN